MRPRYLQSQAPTGTARKIFLALQRLVPFLSDRDGRVTAFMQYASSRLEHAAVPCASPQGSSVAPSGAQRFSRSVPSSPVSLLDSAPASSFVSPFDGDLDPKLSRLLEVVDGEMSVREMMAALNFHSRDKFLKQLSE